MVSRISLAIIVPLLLPGFVLAQSNIDTNHKYAWGENIGWSNWRDANGGAAGVRVHATFLSGYVWAGNIGWINVGNAAPANGISYANVNGSDFGVNINPATGDLFGLAWGENIGWVNFDTRAALDPHGQQARFEFSSNPEYWSGRFRGYAWGENVGWINLDDAAHYVAMIPISCLDPFADADGDNDADQVDFGAFQRCISGAGKPTELGCECFDRPKTGLPYGDNDVDTDDLSAFEACASAPGIPVDPNCDN